MDAHYSQTAHVFFIIWPEKVWMQVTCVLSSGCCCFDIFFASIGSIYSYRDNLGTVLSDWQGWERVSSDKQIFLEIVNFSKTHFSFCRCNFAINFFRDNRDLPNIVRGIWEDTARSRPLRQGARHRAGGGEGGRKSNYPCVNPASKTDIDPAIIQFFSEFHI